MQDDALNSMMPVSDIFSLHDRMVEQAKQEAERQRKKVQALNAPSASTRLRDLVEDDNLMFRVMLAGRKSPPKPGKTDRVAEGIAQVFQAAFGEVWEKIPWQTRQQMLAYWQDHRRIRSLNITLPEPRSPAIRIVGAKEWSESAVAWCDNRGYELTFPAVLVVDHPERLRWEIACTLAAALRWANKRHQTLHYELCSDPFDAWESGPGADVTEEEKDAEWERLSAICVGHYEVEVAKIAHEWGVERPAAKPPQHLTADCKKSSPFRSGER